MKNRFARLSLTGLTVLALALTRLAAGLFPAGADPDAVAHAQLPVAVRAVIVESVGAKAVAVVRLAGDFEAGHVILSEPAFQPHEQEASADQPFHLFLSRP